MIERQTFLNHFRINIATRELVDVQAIDTICHVENCALSGIDYIFA